MAAGLPQVNIDINMRSPIAAIIGGLGSAIGGIGNVVGSSINLASNTIKTVGEIVHGATASGGKAPDQTVNEDNLGLIAAAAQQSVKGKSTGGGTLPAPRTATKQAPSQNLSTQKLLSIAVKHLESIDATLKSQLQYNVEAAREEAVQQKENQIEGKNNFFTNFADRMKMKASSVAGTVKQKAGGFLETAAMVAAGALILKLSTLKPETIEKLKKSINEFQEKYKWLFEDLLPFLSGAMLGANVGKIFGPWGAFIGAIAGGLLSWGITFANLEGERAKENRDQERAEAVDKLIPEASEDLKKVLGNWIDKRNNYTDVLKGSQYTSGEAGYDPTGEVAKADKQQKEAWAALTAQLKKEGYTDKQIAAVTNWAKKSTMAQLTTLLNNPENWKDLLRDATEQISQGRDATPASQTSGTIPAGAYDVVWNNGKDLAPPKPISQMTVDEVLAYQTELGKKTRYYDEKKKAWYKHTYVGAYQITQANIEAAKKAKFAGITGSTLFNAQTQEAIARSLFERGKGGNLKAVWASLPHAEQGYYKNFTFDQMKQQIVQGEVGAYVDMPKDTALAQGVGTALTTLGNVRGAFLDMFGQERIARDEQITRELAVDKKANEIRENAKKLEEDLRGAALKEEKRKAEVASMTPGAMLAKANQGKLEAIDPNYKTDPNNIISKYFVHFGLAA